ncbi:hypothetical protein RFI_20657 [Reticulomyxa filosa]|uniref:Uncharacterized protein n=1 Tax=Reticulomyxa filosa TaxID=46433 RepID=X6MSL7_RETFI|nr:hypothetical protein RFI_20657 [Reticulomyxa filosa]|eukprot:ETO16681.1 hypothetical protein RFI_20657 [Reticulomyxa filosa]
MSGEFERWCRTEIEKMNKDVDAGVVIQMLCEIHEEKSIRDNVYDVFGNNPNSVQFVDTFLLNRKSERQNALKTTTQQPVNLSSFLFLIPNNEILCVFVATVCLLYHSSRQKTKRNGKENIHTKNKTFR